MSAETADGAEAGGDKNGGAAAANGGAANRARQASRAVKDNWPLALKVVQLVLSVFCVGLIVDPLNYGRLPQYSMHHAAMIFTAFAGYIIINSVLILGQLVGETVGFKTSMAFSIVGTVVYAVAGAIIVYDWNKYMHSHVYHPSKHYMDMMISSAVFSIVNAVVFLLDAIFTFREEP